MEDVISGIASGFGNLIFKILGSPLDFLSGKSCSSVCSPTWDFICYIENFCVSQLFKLAMVAILLYFVLLFFFLLYELGICKCICWGSCKIVWGCIATWFSMWEYCCYFLFQKLHHVKRVHRGRHRRDIERLYTSYNDGLEEESSSSSSYNKTASQNEKKRRFRRDYRNEHLRRSLRPRTHHRISVGVTSDSGYVTRKNSAKHWDDEGSRVHDIRVAPTSKFARKSGHPKHRRRR